MRSAADRSQDSHLAVGGGRGVVQLRCPHEEPPLLIVIIQAIVVLEQGGAGAVHSQVSVDITVTGGGCGEGGPAAQGAGLATQGAGLAAQGVGLAAQGAGLAAHAAGPAADATKWDGTNDQRQLQGQLVAAGDVQVDLKGGGESHQVFFWGVTQNIEQLTSENVKPVSASGSGRFVSPPHFDLC